VIEVQTDVAFQTNRETSVTACRKHDRATTGGRRGVDRLIHGRAVERFAVAFRAECFDIKNACAARDVFLFKSSSATTECQDEE
jgi:hypothetical protein